MLSSYLFNVLYVVVVYLVLPIVVTSLHRYLCRKGIGAVIDARATKPNQIRNEIPYGMATCLIAAACLSAGAGYVAPYASFSYAALFLQFVLFAFVYDLYMYLAHRLLHTNVLARFHGVHHRSVVCTPWASLSMHPIEAVLNYLPFLVLPVLYPMADLVLYGMFFYLLVGIIHSHSNYDLLARSKVAPLLRRVLSFHQGHHSNARGSYGFAYTHWDSVFGTKLQAGSD